MNKSIKLVKNKSQKAINTPEKGNFYEKDHANFSRAKQPVTDFLLAVVGLRFSPRQNLLKSPSL